MPERPTCLIGYPANPCGDPMYGAIAAGSVAELADPDTELHHGATPLCEYHFTTPASEWRET